MKRIGNLYTKIISKENLREAHNRAKKKKTKKPAVKYVESHLEECVTGIHEVLRNHEYRTSNYRTKVIYEPKERIIYVLPYYPDRIVQHAIMLVLEDIWDARFLDQSFACRKGKGQHRGSVLCMKYVRRYRYVLKCDVSKFFHSIPHRELKAIIRHKIKCPETLALLDEIIDSINRIPYFAMLCIAIFMKRYTLEMRFLCEAMMAASGMCGKNTPIGNYLSQWCGNLFLNELDTLMKHKYHIKAYLRYCDDFLLFSDSKDFLNDMKRTIQEYMHNTLRLRLSKLDLFPVTRGVDFLGYRHFPDGHILARKSTLKRQRKNVKAIMYELKHGKINKTQALSKIASAEGWLKWANTHNLQMKMDLQGLKKEIMGYEEIQRDCKS